MYRRFQRAPRNIKLLMACQIISMSGVSMVVLLGGLIGAQLSPLPTLTTLPLSIMVVGLAAATIPASLIMKRIGRKQGFMLGTFIAFIASLVAFYAVVSHDFVLFCIATFLIGTNTAFVQQYRFAAIESVPPHRASLAVSVLLMAGIISGFAGPEIAKRSSHILTLPQYSGAFIILAFLYVAAIGLLSFLQNVKPLEVIDSELKRSLRSFISQPIFLLAVMAALVGYGVMSFIMTATPIHLHQLNHFSLDHTVFVIQSHIIAMFLPSLLTGVLIQKFGIIKVMFAGITSLIFSVLFSISANTIVSYWVALVLLGIGWNFLFISSTVLLPYSYTVQERFKAQGINDFLVFGSQIVASFSAGLFLFTAGWRGMNIFALLPLGITAVILFLQKDRIVQMMAKSKAE